MHLTGWNPNITLDLSLLENWIIIDNVKNRTYILTAGKPRQKQVNCLLRSKPRFLNYMTVNYLKMEILLFQARTNPLCLSSLNGWVQDSAFSAYWFLISTPQICYIYVYCSGSVVLLDSLLYTGSSSVLQTIMHSSSTTVFVII